VTRRPSPKLGAYAGLAALGLFAALAAERPELAALASPFALIAALGLLLSREPEVSVDLSLSAERVFEGDEVPAVITVESPTGVSDLELLLILPPGLGAADGENRVALGLRPGERRQLPLKLSAERWGAYRVGDVILRARDGLGAFHWEARVHELRTFKAYPRPERAADLLQPERTQVFSGNYVSRERGEGIEFADLRPFAPGDRLRRINWRASARRGTLWVNEAHPERNADVVLFLDTFAEARRGGPGTLDLAVAAAGSLAERYLRHKDRVGLVGFGGILNWLLPATGVVQLYRIVDSLLDTEIVLNYAWKDLDVIPVRTLPPKALVVAMTPLIDKRAVAALIDLRRRGFDLAVIEIDPAPYVDPGPEELEQLAFRLWRLRREALRAEYERVGVPVVPWRHGESLQVALEEVRSFRRGARAVRA
jgi:uncharacterized protein (DUF58 family)